MRDHKIVATLTYGKKCSVGLFIVMIAGLVLCAAIVPLTIVGAVACNEYAILSCLIIPLIGIPWLFQIIIFHAKEFQEIKLWTADAVPITAHAVEEDRIVNRVSHTAKIRISVAFIDNNKDIIRVSGPKNRLKANIFYIHPGYDAVYRNYIGRPINILYSRKYDQVLLLKD